MRINETDTGILFILTNKEIKGIKRSLTSMSISVAKGDTKINYSFISEKAFDNQVKRVAKQELQLMEQRRKEDECKQEKQSTSEKVGVHTESENKQPQDLPANG